VRLVRPAHGSVQFGRRVLGLMNGVEKVGNCMVFYNARPADGHCWEYL
jgi:hypothetical protein